VRVVAAVAAVGVLSSSSSVFLWIIAGEFTEVKFAGI